MTPYSELADVLDNLPLLMRERRRAMRLSMRHAARVLGCSFSTVQRIENGEDFNSRLLPGILRWLDGPA